MFNSGAAGSFTFDPRINYYSILGLKDSASECDIKKAFYTLAKKYHPDAHNNDEKLAKSNEEKFKEVSSAYEVLGDKDRKKDYDE